MDTEPSDARTPAGDAFSGLVIRVFQLNGRLGAAGDALAKPAGQSTARWQVLASIEDAPRTVAHIARALGLARQSVQRVADLLVGDGLAAYEENPGHRRAKLSPSAGRPKGPRSIQLAQRAWADGIGAQVGRAELERAVATLDRALRALGAVDRRPAAPDRLRRPAALPPRPHRSASRTRHPTGPAGTWGPRGPGPSPRGPLRTRRLR